MPPSPCREHPLYASAHFAAPLSFGKLLFLMDNDGRHESDQDGQKVRPSSPSARKSGADFTFRRSWRSAA
ncbi:hypothetical protein B8V81_0483 [Paenibacillus pasadenensis]|uniref:Uncharacterized protein n=1 Tax=Paenibacillus pasadenensis TaxID=217090 RepID=A0A2N5NDC6_9BACL|nr:hypothetical protein B8V81_0483 [Paenibacillus pasadenensis]